MITVTDPEQKRWESAWIDFTDRTARHIRLVQKKAVALARSGKYNSIMVRYLLKRAVAHDRSKFSAEEANAYCRYWHYLTEEERKDCPEEARTEFEAAWEHHCLHNDHHPQHFTKALGLENADSMGLAAVLEMVCDWGAMADELGGSARDFATDNMDALKIRAHEDEIWKAIDILENGS